MEQEKNIMLEYILNKDLYGFTINLLDDNSMEKSGGLLEDIYKKTSDLVGGQCSGFRKIIFPIRYNVEARYINLSKEEIAEIQSKIQGKSLDKITLGKNHKIIELLSCPKMKVYCCCYREKQDIFSSDIISIFEIECSDIIIK